MNHTDNIKENSTTAQQTDNNSGDVLKYTTSLAMIMTLGGVAMLSGLLVVLTWQLTLESINENQRVMIEKAIFKVIPGAQQRQSYTLSDKGLESGLQSKGQQKNASQNNGSQKKGSQNKGLKIYAAYDIEGQLKGIAAEAAAQGYAGMVRLLYGYDPQCECIRGFSIIKMAETPGLGDKILTDKNFLANFKALDARLNSEKTGLENSILTVKHGSKKNPWEIDAISGATITSKAIGKAIHQSAEQLLPRLQPFLKQLHFNSGYKQIASNDKHLAPDEKQVASDAASPEGKE
jgi:electron transport complex protein RnfG